MTIDSNELQVLMVQVAVQQFSGRVFHRRELLLATEREVRRLGFWTTEDDPVSASSDPKSHGLANIDYRFSDLAAAGFLVREHRDRWRLGVRT